MKKVFALLLCVALIVTVTAGCNKKNKSSTEGSVTPPAEVEFQKEDTEMFTDRDYEVGFDESTSVSISLNGSTASSSSDSVVIKGSTVTVTQEATYIISGSLDDGMIVVNAPDTAKLQLVFNGVNITSKTSAPLYILEADKVFVTLADKSENALSNGGEFKTIDDNNIDAAVFSKQDITFNGSGSLTVNSPVGHGIVSKDDLVITSGTYTINSASQGIDANDSIRIANATVSVSAGKDGIHAENDDDTSLGFVYISSGVYDIKAEGDGISAGSNMQIKDGTFNIVTGGGSVNAEKQTSDSWGDYMGGMKPGGGMGGRPGQYGRAADTTVTSSQDESSTSIKGIKAAKGLLISGGSFIINSADDAVHSNESVTINGGRFEIATGDDAFHADEYLTITAGTVNVIKSYEGLEGLYITVTGGDIRTVSSDDGINAAGGTDSSGYGGVRGNEQFGGPGGKGGGGMGGGMSSSSNGSIVISGGTLYINSSGDGIDANGTLTISDGNITVCGPTQGDTATLDYDVSAIITGGTFIGTGASGMAQSFSSAEQGVIAVSVGDQSAETEIILKDKSGKTIISYAPELSFAVVILSSPEIKSGETYALNVGAVSGDVQAS